MSAIYVHGRTDRGQVREINEDALHLESMPDGGRLLIVADGLGGHGGGDVASRLATDVISMRVREAMDEDPRQVLFEALQQADAAVTESQGGGGSTVVVAWLRRGQAWVAWMGDSRLAHVRDGVILDRTEDHTRVADLVASGQISPQQAEEHPDRHVVTRALGGGEANPDVWDEPVALKTGDALLLYSDGLHDLVDADEMVQWASGVDYRDAVESLVNLANERGGTDNITVAIAVVGTPRIGGQALPFDKRTPAPQPPRKTLVSAPDPLDAPIEQSEREPAPQSPPPSRGLPISIAIVAILLAMLVGLVGGFVGRGLVTPDRAAADLPAALP